MPKNRNRSVTNSFDFPSEILKNIPVPEKINVVNNNKVSGNLVCSGEPVAGSFEKHSSASSNCSGLSDIEIISFGKSSSSSVSWGDEFDAESTQNVQREFERMERVLQGREIIPPHYHQDEYKQWIKVFPQFCVIGNKLSHTKNINPEAIIIDGNNGDKEEVIALHSDYFTSCDNNDITSSAPDRIDAIKNTVIEQVFQNISSKLFKRKSSVLDKAKTKSINDQTRLVHNFNNALRISPAPSIRQPSSQSICKSERLASKWMTQSELLVDYSSLPYLSPLGSAKHDTKKSLKQHDKKNTNLHKSVKSSPLHLVLPPIKNLSGPLVNQHLYRSISATPRKPTHKKSSAVSVQAMNNDQHSKLDNVSNYILQNDSLERRKKHVKPRK